MPRVSIGLPVYNGASYIAQALDYHLAQTYSDFEIIVCDNCSSDATPEILESYVARDSRIKYFRSDRVLPPAENHNRTFELSSGTYFKWSAHDDLIDSRFLELCVAALDAAPDVVLAYGKTRVIDSDGEILEDYAYELNTEALSVSQRFGSLVRADHRKHGAFEIYGLTRADALSRIPPMGNYPRGDSLVLARLSLIGRFRLIPEITFFSRDHSTRSIHALPTRIKRGRSRLHRFIGTGPLPPLEWWDPTKKGKIDFPEWRVAKEYWSSIANSHLGWGNKLACLGQIAIWLTRGWMKLARDLAVALELAVVGSPKREDQVAGEVKL